MHKVFNVCTEKSTYTYFQPETVDRKQEYSKIIYRFNKNNAQ